MKIGTPVSAASVPLRIDPKSKYLKLWSELVSLPDGMRLPVTFDSIEDREKARKALMARAYNRGRQLQYSHEGVQAWFWTTVRKLKGK
jgi:hypothetical protein